MGREAEVKFHPYKRVGGAEKVLAMLKRVGGVGEKRFSGSFDEGPLSFSYIEGEGWGRKVSTH